ncbi:MAG: ketol-acid reductoisomerase [Deltaproteobacteria bacterium]|nr:ketol-acid reductoisomerase [Deltaproteobacteria bacterium]
MTTTNSFHVYYEDDADLQLIRGRKVAIIGYGSQGHAHALNLRDNEVDVVVGLPESSKSRAKAEAEGLRVLTPAAAAAYADVVMLLVPDEVAAAVYEQDIAPALKPGDYLVCAHGFNFHFDKIAAPAGVSVFLVAPKGPGHMVRRQFSQGKGVPCLVATLVTGDQKSLQLALSYAKAIGGTRAGVYETTFKEETETDLFGEQAVLCGGLTSLIQLGFETLVENGYSPAMAYFECVHEMKLIVDLIYEGGLAHMRSSISNTAEYGDYTVGPKIIDHSVRERMQKVLENVQSGEFASDWLGENKKGAVNFKAMRTAGANHLMEQVGRELRSRMSFAKPQ